MFPVMCAHANVYVPFCFGYSHTCSVTVLVIHILCFGYSHTCSVTVLVIHILCFGYSHTCSVTVLVIHILCFGYSHTCSVTVLVIRILCSAYSHIVFWLFTHCVLLIHTLCSWISGEMPCPSMCGDFTLFCDSVAALILLSAALTNTAVLKKMVLSDGDHSGDVMGEVGVT